MNRHILPTNILQWLRKAMLFGIALTVSLATALPLLHSAQAAGGIPSTLFDPPSTGWASVRNMTSSQFSDYFQQKKADGYRVADLEILEIDGQQRVGAIFVKNTDGRGWASLRNLTHAEFSAKWKEYRDDGYRLIDQESYVLSGQRYYAGVWIENKEGLDWASFRNLTHEQFKEKFAYYRDAGYMPIDVEGYPFGSGLRYSVIWVRNVEGLKWKLWRNLSSDGFGEKFNAYKSEYRLVDTESYRYNGKQYYAGIWVENQDGRKWAALRNMTAKQFGDNWAAYRDAGYRLADYEVYTTGSGVRYSGIWRQNSDRPDWHLKAQVDALSQTHLDSFTVPGMSVAIAQDGKLVYLRGFGFADVANANPANSYTSFRLASVAKAVAGPLALRLQEQGVLADLDNPTSTELGTLPAHHTHTLRQLLSNRSGIGHYPDYSVPIQQYDTALAAAQTFWNTDSNPNVAGTQLVYAPGTNCIYSTHASTVLGAALEAATGKSIGTIIRDEIATPFGLPTIQVENRNDGNSNRSKVYAANNSEATPDNISWKVLGGGMESSAYDLVRFGMRLLNGTYINAASLTEMQTTIAPAACNDPNWGNPGNLGNYALGWSVGTEQGTPVLWKGGNQTGSNAFMRMYPERGIVIVILSNRNQGHATGTLAGQIGTLLLDNPLETGTPGAARPDAALFELQMEEAFLLTEIPFQPTWEAILPHEEGQTEEPGEHLVVLKPVARPDLVQLTRPVLEIEDESPAPEQAPAEEEPAQTTPTHMLFVPVTQN